MSKNPSSTSSTSAAPSTTSRYTRANSPCALDTGARAIIVFHIHPSGGPDPSRADIEMTNRLHDGLTLIEVTLHDHPIVTATDAFSYREQGLLQAP